MWDFPLFPDQASTIAPEIDLLYYVLIGLTLVFSGGVTVMILYYGIKYRAGSDADRTGVVTENLMVETTWVVIPGILGVAMFGWAATTYFDMRTPPTGDTIEIYATGKQWMWKFQHGNGAREINTLHVPRGRTVKMIMTSQDVIHSFYVPAFRIKQDVLPGQYTNTWFEATKTGSYHLLCAEYCGTEHSMMGGKVYVMEPAEYERWLRLGATYGSNTEPGTGRMGRTPTDGADPPLDADDWTTTPPTDMDVATPEVRRTMAEAGAQLFEQYHCNSCHRVDSTALYPAVGPILEGVYGHLAELQNDRAIIADAQYIRESIMYPQAKLVAGYPAVMPTYKGQMTEEELSQIVAYIASLSSQGNPALPPDSVATESPPGSSR